MVYTLRETHCNCLWGPRTGYIVHPKGVSQSLVWPSCPSIGSVRTSGRVSEKTSVIELQKERREGSAAMSSLPLFVDEGTPLTISFGDFQYIHPKISSLFTVRCVLGLNFKFGHHVRCYGTDLCLVEDGRSTRDRTTKTICDEPPREISSPFIRRHYPRVP